MFVCLFLQFYIPFLHLKKLLLYPSSGLTSHQEMQGQLLKNVTQGGDDEGMIHCGCKGNKH